MTTIPTDIEAIISRVDRDRDWTKLPRADSKRDKYDRQLTELFPQYKIQNLTEFDYGRSFRYSIVLSESDDAAAFDKEKLAAAILREGAIEAVDLAVSVLGPYAQIRFARHDLQHGQVVSQWADEPFDAIQQRTADTILDFLSKLELRVISPDLARTVMRGVATELTAPEDATVADCLFYG
jgi:hypothetical protein